MQNNKPLLSPARISAYEAGGFIGDYQRLIKDTVIPYQYSVLCDKAADTEKSHVIQNFKNAGAALRGEDTEDGFYGMVFQDSDAAKWLEAAAYSLLLFPDKELEKTADGLIDLIEKAQDADGYLNTYYTIENREKRWTNLQEGHELYCSGHMMEAACAYYEATGKDRLLRVMEKNAEHIYRHFIVEDHEGFPGHPEVELALLKLYRATGNEHCLALAEHFINVRGVDSHFYEKESKARGWNIWNSDPCNTRYTQSHLPVRSQSDAVGHAVRAVYLYTGMADLASMTGDKELLAACKRLWESITQRRMYITGGIGTTVIGEAFTTDYDLPCDTAYAETCASIGLMFFASKMLENEIDSKYADVMERAFYNTVLAGMQLDGKRFFYVNPLEVVPGISGVSLTHLHDLPTRPKWYACACCPPNVARLVSSFGKYAYGENEDTAFCHLFAEGRVRLENGMRFTCKTGYPFDFTVTYQIEKGGKLALRIPAFSPCFEIRRNGEKMNRADGCSGEIAQSGNSRGMTGSEKSPSFSFEKGYARLDVKDGDTVTLTLDGTPYFVYASTKVPRLTGKAALCRGPLVYCFEGADNEGDVLSLAISDGSANENSCENPIGNAAFRGSSNENTAADGRAPRILTAGERAGLKEGLPENAAVLSVDALRKTVPDSLYTNTRPGITPCRAIAVPYYTWGNRGENQMRVWMDLS